MKKQLSKNITNMTKSFNVLEAGNLLKALLFSFLFITLLIPGFSQDFAWGAGTRRIGTSFNQTGFPRISSDASGNAYITSTFGGTMDFNPGPGTASLTSLSTIFDAYILKLDNSGGFVWVKHLANGNGVGANDIVSDANGNTYIVGSFAGTLDFDTGPGTFNLSSAPGSNPLGTPYSDIYILKLNAAGNFLWAKSIGGSQIDVARQVSIDGSGNVCITGTFGASADFDPGPGVHTLSNPGMFIMKLSSAGNFIFAKSLGGGSRIRPEGMALGSNDEIHITGRFRGTIDFDPGVGTANRTSATSSTDDIFVLKLDASGNYVWAKRMGGNGGSSAVNNDIGYDITVDGNDNVITSGVYYTNVDFDPGPGTTILTNSGSFSDMFIQKLNAAGNLVWARKIGGGRDTRGYGVDIDGLGNVYATGSFNVSADFDPGPGSQVISTGSINSNAFLLKLDAAGLYENVQTIGGSSDEIATTIDVNADGDAYIAGRHFGILDVEPGPGVTNVGSSGAFQNYYVKFEAPVINTPPSASCVGSLSLSLDASGNATVAASDIDAGSTDAVGIASLTVNPSTFDCSNIGGNTVTLTVTNNISLVATCTATVTISDDDQPTLNCPNPQASYPNDNGNCSASLNFTATASDNCGNPTVTYKVNTVPISFPYSFPVGSTLVDVEASDGTNISLCDFLVTVVDTEAPTISCPQPIVQNNDAGVCGAVVSYNISTGDNCSGESESQTAGQASGSTFPIGTTTNSFTVTDANGNTAACSFTVTINDSEAPTATCPQPIVQNNDAGVCGAVVTYNMSTGDNCSGENATQTAGQASGSTFPIGTTTNSFTVTDASGNTAACSFTVTINDSEAPTVTCPQPIAQNNDAGVCGAVVSYNISTGDNCSGENATQTTGQASGSTFPIGTTTNSFTVTDASGNTAACSFTVTINDSEAPTVTCPQPIAQNNDAGVCGAVVTYNISTGDNCSGENESQTAGQASGSTFPIGTTTNSFTVTDASGNTAACSFTVTINDSEAPTVTCPQPIVQNNDAGVCGAVVTYNISTGDNCSGESESQTAGQASGSTFPIGTTTNSFTVTDASGNTAACSFTVTINDSEGPTINCPSNLQLPNDAGNCSRVVTYIQPNGEDNCASNTVRTAGLGSGSAFPVGLTTESYVVTDASGNTASCSFSITITDTEQPVLTLIGDNPVILCEGDSYVEYGALAVDNCDQTVNQHIQINSSHLNTNQAGNYIVTYEVTDASGNSAIQLSRTVQVKPTPAQLAPQNCGSCSQIRFDFCEGEATPDLEALLMSNANYESGVSFLWYADDNNSQGNPVSTPIPNMSKSNTGFYWVSQLEDGCEGLARRVRVRVRKTSLVVLDLPVIGCNTGQIDLAAWVSDSRNIATGFTFYDSDPDLGSPSPIGSVTASQGIVDNGQYAIINLPAGLNTYYAVASNNTGCQVTGNDQVNVGAGASLDPINNLTVNAGDLVNVSFSSPDASYIVWVNHSSFNNPYIGILGSAGWGNLIFTAFNNGNSPITATIRAIAYNGNCAGEVRDFTITVLPGSQNRAVQNSLQLTARRINAHDVMLSWQIQYEFPLASIEIEKQRNDGEWVTIGHKDPVGTDHNLSLQEGTHLDRGGMGNETKYRLKLIHPDGRAIWSQEVEVNFDYFDSKRFTLYPNPTNGRFSLRAAGELTGEWTYHLSDGMGRTIQNGSLAGNETAFDISQQPTGYYFLVLTSPEGKTYLQKVVKR